MDQHHETLARAAERLYDQGAFVHKRLGMTAVGPVDAMLLTKGVALTVRRDRPLVGLARLTVGCYRACRSAQSERCPACGAS